MSNPTKTPDAGDELLRILDRNTFTDERAYSEPLRDNLMQQLFAWSDQRTKAVLSTGHWFTKKRQLDAYWNFA